MILEPLGLSVTEAATALGVTRVALSRVLNGEAALSAEMAIRLALLPLSCQFTTLHGISEGR